jgi:aarF domain-containing kinase
MIFGEDAPLHCDPHGGNIAIRHNPSRSSGFSHKQNFDVILYDHGLYRDIPTEIQRSYAHLWLSILAKDEGEMRKWSYEVAGVTDEDFRLFASAITGRDYKVLTSKSVTQERTAEEKKEIGQALAEGMLSQLVTLLGRVPPIILLILKTNDLTRSLDEGLKTRLGPVRNFLILARYCARTVWREQKEIIRRNGSLWSPVNWPRVIVAWFEYAKVGLKLEMFEKYLSFRRVLGYEYEVM